MGTVVEIVGIHSYVDIAGVWLSHLALSTPNLLDLIAVHGGGIFGVTLKYFYNIPIKVLFIS